MKQELNTLLVDDEKVCLDIIRSSLDMFDYVNIVGEVNNGRDVINILQKKDVDLLLLDIEMEGISGFDLAKHIQLVYPEVMVIFLTGHVDFALEGYEYQPVDFLIKPVDILRLEQALAKAREIKYNYSKKQDVQIGIPVGGGLEIINVSDILYMERAGRKVNIVCKDGDIVNTSDSLRKLEDIFNEHNFFRSHQSFLVPLHEIRSIQMDKFKRTYVLHLKNTEEILPLSRDRYNELKELLISEGLRIH